MAERFISQLLRRITDDLTHYRPGNRDHLRFSDRGLSLGQRVAGRLSAVMDETLARLGVVRNNTFHRQEMQCKLDEMEPHVDGLEWLYQRLADNVSRQTLVEVIAYWMLGRRHTRLARNNPAYWQAVDKVRGGAASKARVGRMAMLDGWLDEYDLRGSGFDVRLRAHKLNVLNTFLLEQYRFNESGAPVVGTKAGDIIIDGGGCWGDTTLYFAHQAGANGRVHVFEFSPANLKILNDNLALNPELARRVHIHPQALWDVTGATLRFGEAGPATALDVQDRAGELVAKTLTIDDWAASTGVPRVDFIKLDIEGAEARALEGSRAVLQRFKPRLAVALYHSLADFATLPRLIDSILPGHRFHLGHYTIHIEETILFATGEQD